MTTTGHALWFGEARRIIDLTERHGVPIPSISAARASFNFTGITHAEDAVYMVEQAERLLNEAFRFAIPFFPRWAECGSARHRIRTAVLPSGMQVDLVALAAHFADEGADLSWKAAAA